jgi:hypothetical protein
MAARLAVGIWGGKSRMRKRKRRMRGKEEEEGD